MDSRTSYHHYPPISVTPNGQMSPSEARYGRQFDEYVPKIEDVDGNWSMSDVDVPNSAAQNVPNVPIMSKRGGNGRATMPALLPNVSIEYAENDDDEEDGKDELEWINGQRQMKSLSASKSAHSSPIRPIQRPQYTAEYSQKNVPNVPNVGGSMSQYERSVYPTYPHTGVPSSLTIPGEPWLETPQASQMNDYMQLVSMMNLSHSEMDEYYSSQSNHYQPPSRGSITSAVSSSNNDVAYCVGSAEGRYSNLSQMSATTRPSSYQPHSYNTYQDLANVRDLDLGSVGLSNIPVAEEDFAFDDDSIRQTLAFDPYDRINRASNYSAYSAYSSAQYDNYYDQSVSHLTPTQHTHHTHFEPLYNQHIPQYGHSTVENIPNCPNYGLFGSPDLGHFGNPGSRSSTGRASMERTSVSGGGRRSVFDHSVHMDYRTRTRTRSRTGTGTRNGGLEGDDGNTTYRNLNYVTERPSHTFKDANNYERGGHSGLQSGSDNHVTTPKTKSSWDTERKNGTQTRHKSANANATSHSNTNSNSNSNSTTNANAKAGGEKKSKNKLKREKAQLLKKQVMAQAHAAAAAAAAQKPVAAKHSTPKEGELAGLLRSVHSVIERSKNSTDPSSVEVVDRLSKFLDEVAGSSSLAIPPHKVYNLKPNGVEGDQSSNLTHEVSDSKCSAKDMGGCNGISDNDNGKVKEGRAGEGISVDTAGSNDNTAAAPSSDAKADGECPSVQQTEAAADGDVDDSKPLKMSFQKTQCLKTKPCKFYLQNRCVRGDSCTFAHADVELRDKPDLRKTRLCGLWVNGQCDTEDCTYAHGEDELRKL